MEFDESIKPTKARDQLYGLIETVNRPSNGVLIQGQNSNKSAVLMSQRQYQKLMDLKNVLVNPGKNELINRLCVLNGLDNFKLDATNQLLAGGYGYALKTFEQLVDQDVKLNVEAISALGTFAVYMLSIQEQNINLTNLINFLQTPYLECLKQLRVAKLDYGERTLWATLITDCMTVVDHNLPTDEICQKALDQLRILLTAQQ